MADDVEQITFNFQVPQQSGNGTAFAGGEVQVDFSNNPATTTGSVTITSNTDTSDTFSTFTTSYNAATQTYSIAATGTQSRSNAFTFSFTGKAPTTFNNVAVTLGSAAYTSASEPVSSSAVCFADGTAILTTAGEVRVEDLRIGDICLTAAGERRVVTWLGHRTLEAPAWTAYPIRVARGAFGPDLPHRELRLSPGHPVLVGADRDGTGGTLVPIMCLINGTSIARVAVPSVTYWHVELELHDILLAEGLPAESYLDWGDRAFFSEAETHAVADPDFVAPGLLGRCRPVALEGPVVEAERRRLDAVFAAALDAPCAWHRADRAVAI